MATQLEDMRSAVVTALTTLANDTIATAQFPPYVVETAEGVHAYCQFGSGEYSPDVYGSLDEEMFLFVELKGNKLADVELAFQTLRIMFYSLGAGTPFDLLSQQGVELFETSGSQFPTHWQTQQQAIGAMEFRMVVRFDVNQP